MESLFTIFLWFTPVFLCVSHLFSFLCCVVLFFYLSSSCMSNECWQCLWIVNSWLLLWFIYYIYYERLERKCDLSSVVSLDICPWHQLPLLKKIIRCILISCVNQVLYGFQWCTLFLVRHFLFVCKRNNPRGNPTIEIGPTYVSISTIRPSDCSTFVY